MLVFRRRLGRRQIPRMEFFRSVGRTIKSTVVDSGILDHPEYEVDDSKKGDGYEVRHYPPSMWVSTTEQGMSWQDGPGRKGFFKLFNFIQGKNERSQKIEMTVPVATRVQPGAGPNCESTFTISFFIPPKNQESAPKPKAEDVFLETWPAMDIYARTFSGYAKDADYLREAQVLTEKLGGSVDLEQSFYFIVGYNSPWQMFNRRNEVWFVKKLQETDDTHGETKE
ncbi:heme-binding protein 2-like [Lineus longissimus]|uniref:heme-binding protein 2-like n=1 Tax=Lineus longissimus TaxID=88925 RepID=UPI002B4D4B47